MFSSQMQQQIYCFEEMEAEILQNRVTSSENGYCVVQYVLSHFELCHRHLQQLSKDRDLKEIRQ